jgi:hypothetical protein
MAGDCTPGQLPREVELLVISFKFYVKARNERCFPLSLAACYRLAVKKSGGPSRLRASKSACAIPE